MKVIIVSVFHLPFGDRNGSPTWEFYNIFRPMEVLNCHVVTFDYMVALMEYGRPVMNEMLLQLSEKEQPDLMLFTLMTDQFMPETIDHLGKKTITVAYLYDDPWRIKYSCFWANHFTYITTSDINGKQIFLDMGYSNVIYSPFGAHPFQLEKKKLSKKYDVTFVGGFHPQREWYLNKIKKSGVTVNVWGPGWNTSFLNQIQMAEVFHQSRINLNLSNCITWDIRCLLFESTNLKALRNLIGGYRQAFSGNDPKIKEMIKFRQFEINACGGFQISYYAEGLERHYEIGKEIAIYLSIEDLIEKIHYYLKHEDERESIAQQGYARTIKDHTMVNRLAKLFNEILP